MLNTHPHSQLPSYLAEAFSELYAEDGLVVLGRGLGWLGLLGSFVRFYGDAEHGYAAASADDGAAAATVAGAPRKPPLVFVLNLRDREREVLLDMLIAWGTPPAALPRIVTNEAGPAGERAVLYARGGVFVVTSRILIVDLLNGTAPVRDVAGMLVAHGDRVRGEGSTEAFILRIFRGQRRIAAGEGGGAVDGGFVKGEPRRDVKGRASPSARF